MTNHHPLAYLSTFMVALFTRLALKKVPPASWMAIFIDLKSKVTRHIENYRISTLNKNSINYSQEHLLLEKEASRNLEDFDEFYKRCEELINLRGLSSDPE
jgi:hypothetical protein